MIAWAALGVLAAAFLMAGCAGKDAEAEDRGRVNAPMEALGSTDIETRAKAVKDVVRVGKAAVPPLLADLKKGTPASRATALLCLERIGDYSVREKLEFFLARAETQEETIYALKALGRLGNASSRELLRRFLGYEAPVRLDPKVGWIADKAKETEQGLVRNQAAESLARLYEFSGVPVLIENLSSNGWVRRDALIRLRRMTDCKVDFGYNLGTSRALREKVIEKWKTWWKGAKDSFQSDWTQSHKVFDVNKRGG